jgi:hypothetical protein
MPPITDTARATAAPIEVALGERTYRFSPLTDADVGELDNWVRARTLRAARKAARGLPEPEAQTLVRQAFARAAAQTWFGLLCRDRSIGLLARLFWQLARRHDPAVSLEAIHQAIAANADELTDALDAFDLLHPTDNVEKDATTDKGTTDRGLSQLSRRDSRSPENADGRRENGTVPFAAPFAAPDKGAIYRALSARYGWTPQTIAQLSLEQQLMYLSGPSAPTDPRTGRPVLTFPTERDYREWHERRS